MRSAVTESWFFIYIMYSFKNDNLIWNPLFAIFKGFFLTNFKYLDQDIWYMIYDFKLKKLFIIFMFKDLATF